MVESNDIVPSLSKREVNKIYFEKRKELKNLIKNMNICLDNNTSTFFLALFYMDLIFENYSLDEIMIESLNNYSVLSDNTIYKINNYVLLSLACLVIAAKYNERDPHVPDLNSFLRIYNRCSKFYFIFSLSDLMKAEVIVLKTLKYKLNYFSLYHYFSYFFANGILFEQDIQDSELMRKYKFSEKKILEKIYVKSREILDFLIEDYDQYYSLFNGKENYITAIEILVWSIEKILNIQITKEQNNFFCSFYHIKINYNKHMEIYSIIKNMGNKKEAPNINISSNINNNYNYNFNYGNNFINSQMTIIKNNIKNPMSISNNNFDDKYKEQKISSDFKTKNSKAFYIFKDKININDYSQFKNFGQINSDNSNIFASKLSYNRYQQDSDRINESSEIKNINSMSDYMIPIRSKESRDLMQRKRESIIKKNAIRRNLTKELISKNDKSNELSASIINYHNFDKKLNISKNMFKSVNNFNEINPLSSSKKNYEKKNNYLNNINYISKKSNKELKNTNIRNINIEYNNSSKSTFYNSWLNYTNPSPKDILNKTKKIFDESNKRIIDYENEKLESSNILINSYINNSNLSNHNLNESNNIYNETRNKSNLKLNNNLSDKNIVYQIKNDYIDNKKNKFKEEKNKENTIIINNNIQINNYLERDNNNSNYYNNSQQNISNIENINFENYINKKYFNINPTNKNIFFSNNFTKNKKFNKDKNRKKINFKKINFLEEINEQLKENKNNNNNNNDFHILPKKSKDNLKLNKDKNNRLINISKFQTYYDYSSFNKSKVIDNSQKDFYLAKHINYNIIEKNNKSYGKNNNNLILTNILNNKIRDNNNSNIYEEYNKINSEYII